MMMTEKEASTRRCCGPSGAGLRQSFHEGADNQMRLCAGRHCMAWREGPSLIVRTGKTSFARFRPGESWYWDKAKDEWFEAETKEVGYCGLAGNPAVTP